MSKRCFESKPMDLSPRPNNGRMINTIDVDGTPFLYFKEAANTEIVEGRYKCMRCTITIPQGFHHVEYDFEQLSFDNKGPVHSDYWGTDQSFIVNIKGEICVDFVDKNGDPISENIDHQSIEYDYVRRTKIGLLSCGSECRDTLTFGSTRRVKFFTRENENTQLYYMPAIGNPSEGKRDVIYFKTDSKILVWAWLFIASHQKVCKNIGIAVGSKDVKKEKIGDIEIKYYDDVMDMFPDFKCLAQVVNNQTR